MSTHSINETNGPVQELAFVPKSGVWRGTLVGLIPLGLLAGIMAITLLVTALARLHCWFVDHSINCCACC